MSGIVGGPDMAMNDLADLCFVMESSARMSRDTRGSQFQTKLATSNCTW